MSSKTLSMTSGKPIKLIMLFSLPLMAGNLCQQLYSAIDTIIVSRSVGLSAMASLGAADWIYWFFLWTLEGMTQGFSIVVAQTFGARNFRKLRNAVCMIIILCLTLSILLTIAAELVTRPMLILLRTPDTIIPGAVTYLRIMFAGIPMVLAYNMSAAILRALGNSKLPLLALITASFTNVALDLLFVVVFGWGIGGAAIATVIAQTISFLICFITLIRIEILRPCKADWHPDMGMIATLCRLGFLLGLQSAAIAIGNLVVQNKLNTFGVAFIAGFTAANKVNGILECISAAFGFGLSTYIAQNYGAGKTERIDSGMRSVFLLSLIISVSIGGTVILCRRSLIGLFISQAGKTAEMATDIACHYMIILCSCLFILFLVNIYRNALQGLGRAFGPMLSGMAELGMRVLFAVLIIDSFGRNMIYFCEISAWCGAAAILIAGYYLTINKIHKHKEVNNE